MKISHLEEIKLNFNYIFRYIIYLEKKNTHARTQTHTHELYLADAADHLYFFFPKTKNFVKQ